MKEKKCSFILPTRNVESYIGSLLEAIYGQEYDGDIQVLIQDSSDDKTPQLAAAFPVKIVRVEPDDYNYGKTRNEGAAITDGEFLIFLSTDVEITDKKWLTKLTNPFNDPFVAGVHGRQVPRENTTPMEQFFIQRIYPADGYVLDLKQGPLTRGMVLFSNTNTAVRRSVWENIHIPEMLKSEDQEWAKRVLVAGYKIVYDSSAWVCHSHRYSIKAVFQEYFDSGATMPVVYTGIARYPMSRFIADGLSFVWNEYIFMINNRYINWIPYAIIYDLAKFLGVFLGSKQHYMTLRMKKALCKKKNHWDKYRDVIKEAI